MSKTLEGLKERVFETAVAFKEAEDDPSTGKWARAARWGEYTAALGAHAQFLVEEFKAAQIEGVE